VRYWTILIATVAAVVIGYVVTGMRSWAFMVYVDAPLEAWRQRRAAWPRREDEPGELVVAVG
jgi:hypothetical protein